MLLDTIGEVIFQGVMLRVFETLDETKQEKLTELFEASNQDVENDEKREAIYAFVNEHVPDFETFVREEVELLQSAEAEVTAELAKQEALLQASPPQA